MKHQYRLTPKPGVVRAGRRVNTNVKPVIVPGQLNMIKTQNPVAQSALQKQQVKKVIIKKPEKHQPRVRPKKAGVRSGIRSSPLRQRKELEIARYRKAVEGLKNCGVGRILIMVACGPSIMEADLPKLKDHPLIDFMSINRPDPRLHPTKYWVFCDQSQYRRNKSAFEQYKGTLINAWSVRAKHPGQILVRNKSGKGFSKNLLQGYYIGRSTTYANMQTAYWMNYDKVYIFGCDMCKPPNAENLHFYGVNQDVEPAIRAKRFVKEAEHYVVGSKQLNAIERKKFVFCSEYNPWPFINDFSKMDHRKAVGHILEEAKGMLNQK